MWNRVLEAGKKFTNEETAVTSWHTVMNSVESTIAIDGKLNDPAWEKAERIVLSPLGKTPAEVRTEVRMLRDDKNFYFAFECEEPQEPVAAERKKDAPEIWKDSDVELFLSSGGADGSYYQLLVNAVGSLSDLRFNGVVDYKWDSNGEVKVSRAPGKSWCAEIRIPVASLPGLGDGMRADFVRHRVIKGGKAATPYYHWSFFTKKFGDAMRFGTIRFQPEVEKNLIGDSDFAAKPVGRFLGKWWSNTQFNVDSRYFVTAGASAVMKGNGDCRQLLPLKPDTEYVLSFFLKLENVNVKPGKTLGGFYVRMDDGYTPHYYPAWNRRLHGTFHWQRFDYRFRTSKNAGKNSKPYVNFILRDTDGTAWLDCVSLREVKTK